MYKHLTARVYGNHLGCYAYIWGFKKDNPSYYIERSYCQDWWTIDQVKNELRNFYLGIQILN